MTRQYKRIEELEIWDDFMFGAVMSNKELCKHLLEIILQKKIKDIRYTELQKAINLQYDAKSIRLDVYVEDDTESVYNIEIQTTNEKNLPKRSRYYQGMIDLNVLDKGESYSKLKKSYVIFICNYDPFGKGRCLYRFENVCVDDPSILLEDDAIKIIINPYGKDRDQFGNGFRALMEFLKNGQISDTYTESLKEEITEVKESEEWRRRYMKLFIRDCENIELGKEIGKEIGELSVGIRMLKRNEEIAKEEVAELLGCDTAVIQKMRDLIQAHPDWEAERIASELVEADAEEKTTVCRSRIREHRLLRGNDLFVDFAVLFLF